jgi:hypothetical protein
MTTTFASGTRILTDRGEVSIEILREGDAIETVTGAFRPVVFLGRRRVDCSRHPTPCDVWPVRVRAAAFAEGVPHRDLLLSPDHGVYIDDVLIPIRHLINGATIIQEAVDEVMYWQVELPEHAVIFAEGLPCESYPDADGRTAFENGGKVMQLHPRFTAYAWEPDDFVQLATTRDRLTMVRRYLMDRSGCQESGTADGTVRESVFPR